MLKHVSDRLQGGKMKTLRHLLQSLLLLVAASGLTACSPSEVFKAFAPVDHKAYVCEKFGEIRQTWVSTSSDFDETRARVASLGAGIAVWQTEKGEEDPLFWKMSRYTQDFTTMLMDTNPKTVDAYFATEDEVLAEIEANCVLPSTYVAPLKAQGGCWNNKAVKAQLQSKSEGNWTTEQTTSKLSKIAYCEDPEYPWGVKFTQRRVIQDGLQEFRIVWSDPDGGTFTSGKSKHVSCPVTALAAETEISLSGSDCDQ